MVAIVLKLDGSISLSLGFSVALLVGAMVMSFM